MSLEARAQLERHKYLTSHARVRRVSLTVQAQDEMIGADNLIVDGGMNPVQPARRIWPRKGYE
jgi:hypothetical protein